MCSKIKTSWEDFLQFLQKDECWPCRFITCVFAAVITTFFIQKSIPPQQKPSNDLEWYFTSMIAINIGIVVAIAVQGFNDKMKELRHNYLMRKILFSSGGLCIIYGFLMIVATIFFKGFDNKFCLFILLSFQFYVLWKNLLYIISQTSESDFKLIFDNWHIVENELKQYEASDFAKQWIKDYYDTAKFDREITQSIMTINENNQAFTGITKKLISWHIEITNKNSCQISSLLKEFLSSEKIYYQDRYNYFTQYLQQVHFEKFNFESVFKDNILNKSVDIVYTLWDISDKIDNAYKEAVQRKVDNTTLYYRIAANNGIIGNWIDNFLQNNKSTQLKADKIINNFNSWFFCNFFINFIKKDINLDIKCNEELFILAFFAFYQDGAVNTQKIIKFIDTEYKRFEFIGGIIVNGIEEKMDIFSYNKEIVQAAWTGFNETIFLFCYQLLQSWLENQNNPTWTCHDFYPIEERIKSQFNYHNTTDEEQKKNIEKHIQDRKQMIFNVIKKIKELAGEEYNRRNPQ